MFTLPLRLLLFKNLYEKHKARAASANVLSLGPPTVPLAST
jgi:hypothetical protein